MRSEVSRRSLQRPAARKSGRHETEGSALAASPGRASGGPVVGAPGRACLGRPAAGAASPALLLMLVNALSAAIPSVEVPHYPPVEFQPLEIAVETRRGALELEATADPSCELVFRAFKASLADLKATIAIRNDPARVRELGIDLFTGLGIRAARRQWHAASHPRGKNWAAIGNDGRARRSQEDGSPRDWQ